MNCDSFEARLDELLDGRCPPERWREAEAHVATCPRCRRVLDAVAGRADDMDDAGHDLLALAVVERTSGAACNTVRERLCDFVDGGLAPFDRELVEAHMGRCRGCTAVAAAMAEASAILPSFATLEPRPGLVAGVIEVTVGRRRAPSFPELARAWLVRAAQRPRFSLEVAYVLTVLLLVVLGNPVVAFREASVRVQPRVNVVATAVGRPLADARAAGERTLSRIEQVVRPPQASGTVADARTKLWRWWQAQVDAPVRAILARLAEWADRLGNTLEKMTHGQASEPSASAPRSRG